jgi:transcription termination/antitermination protein NusG
MPTRVFRIGDKVRILEGPFASFTGSIEGINQAKALLKVRVDIYGRASDVKVSFGAAEKLEFDPPQPPLISEN